MCVMIIGQLLISVVLNTFVSTVLLLFWKIKGFIMSSDLCVCVFPIINFNQSSDFH
jgi:hypothetical protein